MIKLTEQDLTHIKEYIIYSVLLLMLAYNKEKGKKTKNSFKLQNIFEEGYDLLVTEIERDFIRHKRLMKQTQLTIKQEATSAKGAYVLYECRGYHSEFMMWTDYLKGQVEEKLRFYLQRIASKNHVK